MTPNTTGAPAAAPSVASDRAKQFASLAMRTGRSKAAASSLSSGRPLRQVELALRSSPVTGDNEPGVPMPTVPVPPSFASTSRTRSRIAAMVASAFPAGRRNAVPQQDRSAGIERDRFDLGAAEVDADTE